MLGTLVEADGAAAHRVAVMGHASISTQAMAAGVPVDCIKHVHSMGTLDPAGWWGVRKLIRELKPACVHAWGFQGMAAATMLAVPGRRIAMFTMMPEACDRKWIGWMARHAPWLWVAASEQIAQQLREIGRHRMPVEVVRPGIRSDEQPRQDAATLRKALGIKPGDGPIVLLGGAMGERCVRQSFGLWAAAIMQQIYPQLRVLVHTGHSGPFNWQQEIRSVRHLAATSPDPELVIYADPQLRWRDLLQVADVLVATPDGPISIDSVLWAMAAGVPVVATSTPEMLGLIESGHNGLLAPPNKPRAIAAQMEQVLGKPEVGPRLAAAAREFVQREFPAGKMVDELRAIYTRQAKREVVADVYK